MSPLIIHIGAPKTGTTSLQDFLTEHAETLEAHGVVYPAIGRSSRGKHHDLKSEVRGARADAGRTPAWQALHELRKSRPTHRIVISEESFYYLEPSAIARLPDMIGGGPVTVLVYFRDYASHVVSLYAQGMKLARALEEGEGLGTKAGNELLDFDAFFERYMAKPSHFDIISRWAAVFGWPAIQVRPFQRDLLVGGDIVADLLSVMGLSLADLGVTPTREVNSAPGWKSLETLRAVWQALEDTPGAMVDERITPGLRNLCRDTVEACLAKQDGRADDAYLSLAQRRRCAEATARDVAALHKLLTPPGLAMPAATAQSERRFLPSIEQVPSAELIKVITTLAVQCFGYQVEAKRQDRSDRKAARSQAKAKGEGQAKNKSERKPEGKPEGKSKRKPDPAADPKAGAVGRPADGAPAGERKAARLALKEEKRQAKAQRQGAAPATRRA